MKYLLKIFIKIFSKYFQKFRIQLFKQLSNNENISGKPILNSASIFLGNGNIQFGSNVIIGYFPSPYFHNCINHIESRNKNALIKFGSNIIINNNFVVVCDKTKIEISDNVLIGHNVEIFDSDFHELDPKNRNSGNHITKPVLIGENVFIGSNCKILKGVNIGRNSIIANGSIVVNDIPENIIAGGIPAKFIKKL